VPGFDDDSGMLSAVEFILTFCMAAFIFTIFVMTINGLFMNQSKYIVGMNQFTDISNSVSTKIIETYLIAPEDGKIITYFEVPNSIVGNGYTINIDRSEGLIDENINIFSQDGLISVNTTLNAAYQTIPINGSTNSSYLLHKIEYDSTR
jgi:hypothetical protein